LLLSSTASSIHTPRSALRSDEKLAFAMQVASGNMDALCSLLRTPFFHPCPTCAVGGSAQRDTTVNHFNLDRLNAGCGHCLPATGSGQRVLQVRPARIDRLRALQAGHRLGLTCLVCRRG